MIMDLQSAAVALKSPPAICWIKNTSSNCLKNLSASGANPMV
uniref:Similar to PDR8/PEN3 (PLEIOTROPIC DRUG RESISTANCE8) n=1 Tax=Arundo donax TaxID=35708 RepID=A0A0A8Z2K8_ARUDO